MTAYVYTSGGFPSAPTSGDSLFKNGAFYDWTGATWKIRRATPLRSEFIATANQATKTGLTYFVGSIDCYINGAKMLLGTDFTATNGTSVTFTPALDLDDEVQLIMGVSASSAAGASSLASLSDTTVSTTDPLITSNPSAVGHLWVNSTTGMTYICNDITTDGNVWVNTGTGATGVSPILPITGGIITTAGGYQIHTFTSSGTLTVPDAKVVEYLVIAGGGGAAAGGNRGGGSGAGGYRTNVVGQTSGGGLSAETTLTLASGDYTITIGAGGTGAVADSTEGGQGNDSSITNLVISLGGGRGEINGGHSGGSGSGASGVGTSYSLIGGSGTYGQGFSGGNSLNVTPYPGGGGGGAGASGSNGSGSQSGEGGAGQSSSITGTSLIRAGGGGAGSTTQGANPGAGGAGGGGAGGAVGQSPTSGTANTGSGGGATGNGSPPYLPSGSGGSGIVIVRYAI